MTHKAKPLEERFWEKIDKRGPVHPYSPELGPCWLWKAYRDEKGYGQICEGSTSKKMLKAHRVSYKIHNGPIPVGLKVRHSCDNPPCINPVHLLCGTDQDNMDDKVERGRQARGEKNGWAKLTEEQVTEIRRDYVYGSSTYGMPALGWKYSVHPSTIGYIINRKNWK